jgi:hypothetical protein
MSESGTFQEPTIPYADTPPSTSTLEVTQDEGIEQGEMGPGSMGDPSESSSDDQAASQGADTVNQDTAGEIPHAAEEEVISPNPG